MAFLRPQDPNKSSDIPSLYPTVKPYFIPKLKQLLFPNKSFLNKSEYHHIYIQPTKNLEVIHLEKQNYRLAWKEKLCESSKVNERKFACSICQVPFGTSNRLHCYTKCQHILCIFCAIKWIHKSKDRSCVVCRQEVESFLATDVELSDKDQKDARTGRFVDDYLFVKFFYLDKSTKEKVRDLMTLECPFIYQKSDPEPKCKKFSLVFPYKKDSLVKFVNHMHTHDLFLCELCIIVMSPLPHEIPFYPVVEFCQHMLKISEEFETYIKHSACTLCTNTTYFVDEDALWKHCEMDHFACYLCKTYCLSLRCMEQHLCKEHAFCRKCGLGFNRSEIQGHYKTEHPGSDIPLEYLSRGPKDSYESTRSNLDEIDSVLRRRYHDQDQDQFSIPNFESYLINFPSIEGQSSVPVADIITQPTSSKNSYDANFPSLKSSPFSSPPDLSFNSIVSKKPSQMKSEDFPSLSELGNAVPDSLSRVNDYFKNYSSVLNRLNLPPNKETTSKKKMQKPKAVVSLQDDFPVLPSTSKTIPSLMNEEFCTIWPNQKPVVDARTHKSKSPKLEWDKSDFRFKPYYDFSKRQTKLYNDLKKIFESKNKTDSWDKFRILCWDYLQSKVPAIVWYETTLTLLGLEDLHRIIFTIIALLPNIEKQHELYKLHTDYINAKNLPNETKVKPCKVCKQIVIVDNESPFKLHNCGKYSGF